MAAETQNADLEVTKVPLLPLEGALLLPRAVLPLQLFEPRYVQMFYDAMGAGRLVGVIQPATDDQEDENPPLNKVGTLGRITHFEELEEDRFFVGITGISRFKLLSDEIEDEQLYRTGTIDLEPFSADLIAGFGEDKVDKDRFVNLLRSYAEFADFDLDWDEINEAGIEDLINSCSMASPYPPRERQALLEAETLATRAEMLMAFAEIEMSRKDANITMQ
jgi:Lon protease-like protein